MEHLANLWEPFAQLGGTGEVAPLRPLTQLAPEPVPTIASCLPELASPRHGWGVETATEILSIAFQGSGVTPGLAIGKLNTGFSVDFARPWGMPSGWRISHMSGPEHTGPVHFT